MCVLSKALLLQDKFPTERVKDISGDGISRADFMEMILGWSRSEVL